MRYCDHCRTSYPDLFTHCPNDQNLLRVLSELVQGAVVRNKYEILNKIGSGGMATVYRVRHRAFGEVRALKVVGSHLLNDEVLLKRFRTEAVVMRKLQHPNAVRVEDLDAADDGRPFMVMEYVEGRDLRKFIQQEGPVPIPRALAIAGQVAAALSAAHALGITHRDIKPDNILMVAQPDGSELVKVLDFGIARVKEGSDLGLSFATQTGIVVGTPQYISPEQAGGRHSDQIDGRADLYSLGVVLYEMVTGRLPFHSDTPLGMLLHHLQTIPKPPHELRPELHIPEPFSMLLMKALEKDRELRFQTADEMMEALTAVNLQLTSVLGSEELPRRVTQIPAPVSRPTPPPPPLPSPPPRLTPPPIPPPTPRPAPRPTPAVTEAPVVRPSRPSAIESELPQLEVEPPRRWIIPAVVLTLAMVGAAVAFQLTRGEKNQPEPQPAASETRSAEPPISPIIEPIVSPPVSSAPSPAAGEETRASSSKGERERQTQPEPERGAGGGQASARVGQLLARAREQADDGLYEQALESLEEARRLDPLDARIRDQVRRVRRAQQTEREVLQPKP